MLLNELVGPRSKHQSPFDNVALRVSPDGGNGSVEVLVLVVLVMIVVAALRLTTK